MYIEVPHKQIRTQFGALWDSFYQHVFVIRYFYFYLFLLIVICFLTSLGDSGQARKHTIDHTNLIFFINQLICLYPFDLGFCSAKDFQY